MSTSAPKTFNLSTSEGGRGFVAHHFETVLKRYDYTRYINERLAADFACTLAAHLTALQDDQQAELAKARELPPLKWSKRAPPNENGIRYDHVLAETPFGQFSIEWKSWKRFDSFCVMFAGEYVESGPDLEAAKDLAQALYRQKVWDAFAFEPGNRSSRELVEAQRRIADLETEVEQWKCNNRENKLIAEQGGFERKRLQEAIGDWREFCVALPNAGELARLRYVTDRLCAYPHQQKQETLQNLAKVALENFKADDANDHAEREQCATVWWQMTSYTPDISLGDFWRGWWARAQAAGKPSAVLPARSTGPFDMAKHDTTEAYKEGEHDYSESCREALQAQGYTVTFEPEPTL